MTKKRIALKIVRRVGICILTTVVLLLIGLLGVVRIMEFGPSKTARNLFVNSAMESSAGGILVTLFFSDEEIARIRAINSIQKTDEVTDSSLISDTTILTQEEKSMIEVIDIEKDTYRGKMMIVRDPSRVMVGTSGEYGKSCKGKKVSEIAESYGAIAATNAGGFRDAGGVGTGGEPDGLVISEGSVCSFCPDSARLPKQHCCCQDSTENPLYFHMKIFPDHIKSFLKIVHKIPNT